MKKILFLIISLVLVPGVKANELVDVTKDIEVKTKWYKEEIKETYHKKGEVLDGYTEDVTKTKKGNLLEWRRDKCQINDKKRIIRIYKLYNYTQFIRIKNLINYDYIKVLYQNIELNYEYLKNEEKEIIIKLPEAYETHNLLIYIETDNVFDIELSQTEIFDNRIISKSNTNQKLLYIDNNWNVTEDSMTTVLSINEEINSPHVHLLEEYEECASYEELTYRYKIEKKYFDDNYHSFIEGYKRDLSDIKYFYNGKECIKETEMKANIEEKRDKSKIFAYIVIIILLIIIKIMSTKINS